MSRKIFTLFIMTLFFIKANTQIISPSLQITIDNASSSDMIAITIQMSEQYDVASLSQILESMTREEKKAIGYK